MKKGDYIYNYRGQKLQVKQKFKDIQSEYLLCEVPLQDPDSMRGDDWCEGLVLLDIHNDVFMPVNKKTIKLVAELRVAENTLNNINRAITDVWLDEV